jgi:hypothetical protein
LRARFVERALVLSFAAYTWYKATTPFVLNDGKNKHQVEYGDEVGLRKNEKGFTKIVTRKLGPGKVFRVPGNSPEEKAQLFSWLALIDSHFSEQIKKVSTPHSAVTAEFLSDKLLKFTVKNPATMVQYAKSLGRWYESSGGTSQSDWQNMHEFFKYFKIPAAPIWAYRGTRLKDHGRKVALKPGIVITLQTRPGQHDWYQSWSHSYNAANDFATEGSYILKTQLTPKQVGFCGPASFRAIDTFVLKIGNMDMSILTPRASTFRDIVNADYFWKKIASDGYDPLKYFKSVLGVGDLTTTEHHVFSTLLLSRCLQFLQGVYFSYKEEQEIIVDLRPTKKGISSEIIRMPKK